MKSILLILTAWAIAASIGRVILARLKADAALNPLERTAFSSALGLGIAAYGVFALGMLGLLSFWPITLWWLLLAGLGWQGARANYNDLLKLAPKTLVALRVSQTITLRQAAVVFAVCALLFCAFVALAACFLPPDARAWDAIAYHLADPRIFLRHHRILPLPTEHHSNFPFTMEMLFSVGLLYDGYPLANLFHYLTAVLLVFGMAAFCRRFFSSASGIIASLIFLTTPLVLWEASVAYIDLGLSLYVFLSVYAAMIILEERNSFPGSNAPLLGNGYIVTSGILMGFALGIKYLALLPLTLLALLLLLRRMPVKVVAVYILAAVLIGSPWYVKNVLWMRNPVYPFAFSIFPHSRYWSADRAAPYADEQRSFGTEHALSSPVPTLKNLMLTPWTLLAIPRIYTNKADFTFTSLIGGIYAAFLFPLAFCRRLPSVVHNLLIFSALMGVSWFFVSQHIRYLLPLLPFLAVLGGYSADRWMQHNGNNSTKSAKFVNVGMFIIFGSALAGQFLALVWGVCALPVSGRAAQEAYLAGLEPTALSLQEALAGLTQPEQRLANVNRLNSYGAAEWINLNTPKGAGVILYEDVHGFYLDRDYIWGNGEHSSYIPYNSFHTGEDLTRWLRQRGICYALFNLNPSFYPFNTNVLLPDDVGEVQYIMREWYSQKEHGAIPGSWRYIVGDALKRGDWTVVYTHHGVAVLKIGASEQ